jgi:hypothetical protein
MKSNAVIIYDGPSMGMIVGGALCGAGGVRFERDASGKWQLYPVPGDFTSPAGSLAVAALVTISQLARVPNLAPDYRLQLENVATAISQNSNSGIGAFLEATGGLPTI